MKIAFTTSEPATQKHSTFKGSYKINICNTFSLQIDVVSGCIANVTFANGVYNKWTSHFKNTPFSKVTFAIQPSYELQKVTMHVHSQFCNIYYLMTFENSVYDKWTSHSKTLYFQR